MPLIETSIEDVRTEMNEKRARTWDDLLNTISPELRKDIETEMAKPDFESFEVKDGEWPAFALRIAYQRVRPEVPKGPIKAIIHDSDAEITQDAIGFVAGGFVEFFEVENQPNHSLVVAPGYSAVIGS
jgi:hypothetical protein